MKNQNFCKPFKPKKCCNQRLKLKLTLVFLIIGLFQIQARAYPLLKIGKPEGETALLKMNKEQETITVTGTVTEVDTDMPIPGANIMEVGTSNGVMTDFDGKYSIDVPKDAMLEVSYVGFAKQQIKVKSRTEIDIEMETKTSALDEVVVVGYGEQSKESLTGAITKIGNETLEDRPITNVSEGLQGSVGNLNIITNGGGGAPNSKKSINIRGYTGLGQSQSPLVVIDGVQGGSLDDLNPNDIKSISVIKDAASAAVYGSSAPYGVILVTTKTGSKNESPSITLNSNFSGAQPIGTPEMLNSITFANLYNEALDNAGRSPFFSDDAIERMKAYQNGTLKTETIASPAEGADQYLGWGGANANNDWFDIFLKNLSLSQQHNLSVSGGSENSTYYVGAGYNEKEGLYNYGDDSYKRYNLKANLSTDISDWLTFNLRTSYAKELFDTPNAGGNRTGNNWFHQIARKHPNIALHNPDGKFSGLSDVPFHEQGGRHKTYTDKPVMTGEVVLKLAKGWKATVNYTYDSEFYSETTHTKTLYKTLPSGDQQRIDWTYPNNFSRYSSKQINQTFNAFTTYRKKFGRHNFKILAGYVQESHDFTAYSASNNNLYSDDLPSLNLTYGTNPSIGDNIRKFNTRGVFGRFNYDFDGKYLIEVVGRYDGTSRFLEDERWKLYPGVSAGWNVHKENFWKENEIISSLKLRGSFGKLGDQSLSAFGNDLDRRTYPFYPSLGTSSPTSTNWLFSGGREAAVYPPNLVDPTLTWVTTKTLDFGVDATFFDNRLSATFDWYKRSADDYIGPAESLPAVLGTGVPPTNSAALETKGFELTLEWRDSFENFEYGIKGILSDYKGTVTKFPNPKGVLNNWYEGENMGDIWGYTTDRYFTSEEDYKNSPDQSLFYGNWGAGDIKYKDLNGDGKIDYGDNTLENPGDKRIIGNSTPRYSYSFLADAKWKNFDFSLFIQGVGKRDAWLGGNYFFGITGSEWQSSPFKKNLDRWTPETPKGYFPKYYLSGENGKNTQVQTKYLQNAAYMRIKNLQVGFSLPQNTLDAIGMKKFRIYVSIDNLATFTPLHEHSNLDPELSIGNSKIYPLQRTYSLGLNLKL